MTYKRVINKTSGNVRYFRDNKRIGRATYEFQTSLANLEGKRSSCHLTTQSKTAWHHSFEIN